MAPTTQTPTKANITKKRMERGLTPKSTTTASISYYTNSSGHRVTIKTWPKVTPAFDTTIAALFEPTVTSTSISTTITGTTGTTSTTTTKRDVLLRNPIEFLENLERTTAAATARPAAPAATRPNTRASANAWMTEFENFVPVWPYTSVAEHPTTLPAAAAVRTKTKAKTKSKSKTTTKKSIAKKTTTKSKTTNKTTATKAATASTKASTSTKTGLKIRIPMWAWDAAGAPRAPDNTPTGKTGIMIWLPKVAKQKVCRKLFVAELAELAESN